jgi:peptide/nickel transport system ATP-binding protein
VIDLAALSRKELRQYRKDFQMVFQDPYSSLDPRMSVLDIIAEPLKIHEFGTKTQIEERVKYLANVVGLKIEHLKRYPHAFSGGQRQRIGVARALATNPALIIADEPVSALDVSIQAQVLNLLKELQGEFNLTYVFVAHDLSVVEYISDRVAVMYVGKIVELAPTQKLFTTPRHPYTEALLSAVPKPTPSTSFNDLRLEGEVPNPANPPTGCRFHTRCRYAKDVCRQTEPPLVEVDDGQFAACHFAKELSLRGVEVSGVAQYELPKDATRVKVD